MIAAIAPIVIALLSLIIRLINLSTPKGMVFDEVYYVDGARDLLKYGVEVTGSAPEFIVHPPIGKWCIALGIKLFGDHEFGWRIVGAILGTAMILLIALIAHRLFYSPLLTALASALMAIDGMLLVHSRTALLDIFLAFFIFRPLKKNWVLADTFCTRAGSTTVGSGNEPQTQEKKSTKQRQRTWPFEYENQIQSLSCKRILRIKLQAQSPKSAAVGSTHISFPSLVRTVHP